MPKLVDLSSLDETAEDPAALLDALPDVRFETEGAAAEDDLGIRSLLEQPAAFAHPWWRNQVRRS